ncbi:MAG: radical SAM protein [Bacillota bacterium]
MALSDDIKQRLTELGLRQVVRMVARDPDCNIPALIGIARQFAGEGAYRVALDRLQSRLDTDPRAMRKARMVVKNPRLLEKFMVNWVLNSMFVNAPVRRRHIEAGRRCPTVVLVDPTSACNLQCTGCWVGEYAKSDRIEPGRLDRLFEEMKEMGIYWTIFSGGEPLLYPHLLELVEKHDDMAFMVFTNGTLLDDAYADELEQLGNFSPIFSLEGPREQTDARRATAYLPRWSVPWDAVASAAFPSAPP